MVDDIEVVPFVTCVHATTTLASYKNMPLMDKVGKDGVLTLQNNGLSSNVCDWKHCVKYVTGSKEFGVSKWKASS